MQAVTMKHSYLFRSIASLCSTECPLSSFSCDVDTPSQITSNILSA